MSRFYRKALTPFKEIREASGLSVDQISELTGVSRGWIYQFENQKPNFYARVYLAVFYTIMASKLGMDETLFREVQIYGQEATANYKAAQKNDFGRATEPYA